MKQVWMKKMCLIVFAMAMAVSLAGCGGNGNGRQKESDTTSAESQTAETAAESSQPETITEAESRPAGTEAGTSQAAETKPVETTTAASQDGQTSNGESAAPAAASTTAAGSAAPASGGQPAPQSQGLTEADAKQIAFTHANVSEADVSYLKVKLERDKGRDEYDVEFVVGNKEYDYDIDAATGEILSYDYEAESYVPSGAQNQGGNVPGAQNQNQSGTAYITADQAKAAAFAHAGVSEGDVTKLKVDFDQGGGKAEYDIEFEVGHMEYEYEIDALTGGVISFEADQD